MGKEKAKSKAYGERHFQGTISYEQEINVGMHEGDIGVQISEDGRIWICVDGKALIRFKPHRERMPNEDR